MSGSADKRLGRKDPSADSPMQYRDDVGFRMTDEQYEEHQGKYTAWDEKLTEYSGQLSAENKRLSGALGSLNNEVKAKEAEIDAAKKRLDDAAKSTLNSLYKNERKKWVDVRVVDPSGHKIEATYKIPKSSISALTKMGNDYSWVDGGKNFNLSVVNRGRIRGAETHKALRNAESSLKEKFYEKNLPAYTKSRKEISDGYSTLNKARASLIENYQTEVGNIRGVMGDIKLKQGEISNARTEYDTQIESNRKEYEEKRAKRQALLQGAFT